ncbi:putative ADP-heptose:LPS heptosyl transferase [Escherichia coli]|nr:putative ADP-heptose:LPS heptosyl transferase [Escherichia coli]
MFLVSLLRRIAFSYYDYKAYNFNIEKTDFVVIHIPDQIGDAMAIFPVIRALELHKIKHLLIVTSTINLEVFGNDSNLLIVFYVQIMPDDFVMQLHRF